MGSARIAASLVAVTCAAPVVPQETDVVVTGQSPRFNPGLWQFDRSASIARGGSRSGRELQRASAWQVCIASPDIRTGLPDAIAALPDNAGGALCSRPYVRIVGSEAIGRSSCRFGGIQTDRVVRGTVTSTLATLVSTTTSEQSSARLTHTITGRRIGECPPPGNARR